MRNKYDKIIPIDSMQRPGTVPMATVRKTITVTDTQDAWISAQVEAGRFTNDSELIRDLIRREQERIAEVEAVRRALIEGEQSGEPQSFDFPAYMRRKITQHGG